ncbi:hypothetical protein [Parageobacillus thermantarcticus]|uniref:hypothetical protein n=1 Tax=Parageobacillus thermantarcticus TaxID=186116 RepID=UPI001ABF77CB|nr:hypothetical protein [Parageobacillus thermantarcticus]
MSEKLPIKIPCSVDIYYFSEETVMVIESTDRRRAPRRVLLHPRKKLMKSWDGKRNIRWNQSAEVCGDGVSGKGKEDKPPRNKGGL